MFLGNDGLYYYYYNFLEPSGPSRPCNGTDLPGRLDKKYETTVSPTDKGLTIPPTAWKNPYFKEQITIVGLSGIIPQI